VLAGFDTQLFWEALSSGPYWRGALTAFELAALSLAAAIVIGFVVALGALSTRPWVRSFAWVYNWIFRATPTLLQLFFIWYALPQIWTGFAASWFTPFMAAFIALSLNEAAYMSEIIRAGLLSVDPGQELAGRALGISRRRILRRIVVPQAVRIVIPPAGNEFITLLKLTSIATIISLHELLSAATDRAATTFKYTEPLLASLVYYLAIVSVLMVVQSRLERHFTFTAAGRGRRRRGGGSAAPAVPATLHDAR
jgi:His/Glu/Gln/Arg/opine family amino acid ABC transporter permease subunit